MKGLRAYVAGADSRIVPSIKLVVASVPLSVVQLPSDLGVLTRSGRFAGEQTGGPGAVMRLETQFVVGLVVRQLPAPPPPR